MVGLFATHYFWLALGASALNSALLAVTAGIAAKTDGGYLVVLIVVLLVVSHLLSCLYFLSGQGVDLVVHRLLDHAHLHPQSRGFQTVTGYMQRYRRYYVFMYRFIPGLRFISPYIMGLQGLSFWPFFFFDWFAALLWAAVFGVLGFLCGRVVLRVLDDFGDYDGYVFGAIGVVVLGVVVGRYLWRRYRQGRRA